MGFYKNKVNQYINKGVLNLNDSEIEEVRKGITNQFQKELDALVEDMKLNSNVELIAGPIVSNADVRRCITAENELKFVQNLSTEDFFEYLTLYEKYHLQNIKKVSEAKVKELTETIKKYKERIGLIAKASATFGLDKKKIAKNQNLLNLEELKLEAINDFCNDYKELTTDEKFCYVVGRYAVDKQSRFDVRGFEEYLRELFNKKESAKNNAASNPGSQEK